MFKVIIIGGEGFGDYGVFESKCKHFLSKKGAEGCGLMVYTTGDKFNDRFVNRFGIDVRYFPCNWKKNGHDAIKMRNEEMLSTADAAIIFNDGTKDIRFFIEQVNEKKIPHRIISGTE